jgi:hypothetical protein
MFDAAAAHVKCRRMRALLALLLLAIPCFSAVTRLYMKDGTYQLIREYKADGDRIRYYSTERGEWEEIPAVMVDLPRTESEISSHQASVAEETKVISEEDRAVREQQKLVLKIPQDPGVYMLSDSGALTIFKQAEINIRTNKGRGLLQIVAPKGLVNGKATVELNEEHSLNILKEPRPDFYLQLFKDERFNIIKLTPHHGIRIAERVSMIPVINDNEEDVDQIATFTKQMDENGLYKIWPEKPLEPGEYAVIEYTPGRLEPHMWDFQIKK